MLKEKIVASFRKNPGLRILFFFDPGQEFRQEIQNLQLEDIEIKEYDERPLNTKWELVQKEPESKVFLYFPSAQPSNQKEYHSFPLMGLLMANKVLQLDDVGEMMERFGLQTHQKSLLTRYKTELKYSSVQKVCEPILHPARLNEDTLQNALLCAFLKFKEIQSWNVVLGGLLLLSQDKEEKEWQRIAKKMAHLPLEEVVLKKMGQLVATHLSVWSPETAKEVLRRLRYNQIVEGVEVNKNEDPYAQLKMDNSRDLTRINQFFQEVDRNSIGKNFNSALKEVDTEIKGKRLVEVYGAEQDFALYTASMIWTIIAKLLPQWSDDAARIVSRANSLSLQTGLSAAVVQSLHFLSQASQLAKLLNEQGDYVRNRPEEYVQEYVEKGYQIDSLYRKTISSFKKLSEADVPVYSSMEKLTEEVNKRYERHLDQLNREWLRCMDHKGFDYKKVSVPKQYDFYSSEVETQAQKVVVIISDALRYEAAEELLAELHVDAKNTAILRHQLASIPSKTHIGMAQLLPGEKTYSKGGINSSGFSTSGIENRQKILRLANAEAVAIQYADMEALSSDERREVYKSPLVYVYHDVIDARSDVKKSERGTFDAVSDAIAELRRLVKNLHASMNVSKVLITSDHGFLYTEREIQDKEKESIPDVETSESHNRYFITEGKQELELGYSIPFKATTAFQEEFWVNIPFSTNRYRKQGVGHQFVHGGGSLQELVVPIIESSRQRVEVASRVMPAVIKHGKLKVVSSILKVNILQENEVSAREKERTIIVGLYSDKGLVSQEERILLNSPSSNPSERMHKVELTLADLAAQETILKLRIFDSEDKLNALQEEQVQNSTLIQPDF
jgi:uncharacterized protein (TIGR02687 family)